MKNLFRIWLAFFLIAWGAYVATQFLIASTRGHEIDLLEKCIVGAFFASLISLGSMAAVYSIFPRTKYLESGNNEKPSFRVTCSSAFDLPQGFDFNHLKTEIAEKWLITFSDDIAHVVKFRTKLNIFKNMWGTAAWLKFDNEAKKIYLECFPMAGMQDDDLARKMRKEIEKCLQKVVTVQ